MVAEEGLLLLFLLDVAAASEESTRGPGRPVWGEGFQAGSLRCLACNGARLAMVLLPAPEPEPEPESVPEPSIVDLIVAATVLDRRRGLSQSCAPGRSAAINAAVSFSIAVSVNILPGPVAPRDDDRPWPGP